MLSAGDGQSWVGCGYAHPQARHKGQFDVLIENQVTNVDCKQNVTGLDQARQQYQLTKLRTDRQKLSKFQLLDTVSRHIRQRSVASDNTRDRGHCSDSDARGSNRGGPQQASGGQVSKKRLAGSASVSRQSNDRSPSGHTLTTNNNNSCSSNSVINGLPMLATCPDTNDANEHLLLGPDQIDMLLALAVSNCSGSDMVGCCKAALQSSSVGNILRNYLVAVKYNMCDVMNTMINIIRRNFLCISRSREFLSLPLEYILIFMEDSYLNVQNELDMFVTALLWIDYNKQQRIPHSGRVLKCVRYAYIDPGDIMQYVEPNLHLYTGQDGAQALVNLYKHHVFAQIGQQTAGSTSGVPPRRGLPATPARTHIVSGTPKMQDERTSGAGSHVVASATQLGVVPTTQEPSKPPAKAQKGRVSFALNTSTLSKDTPLASGTQLGTVASTPFVEGTPLRKTAGTPVVGNTQLEPVVSTPVVADIQLTTIDSAQVASEKVPENVNKDNSNNARLCGHLHDRRVDTDPSVHGSNHLRLCGHLHDRRVDTDPSVQTSNHQLTSSYHSGINGRYNCAYPSRPADFSHILANGCPGQFVGADLTAPGYSHVVRTSDVTRSTCTGLTDDRKSAWTETVAARKTIRSVDFASAQDQERSGKRSQQQHVFLITQGLSRPVVSIAYPHSHRAVAS